MDDDYRVARGYEGAMEMSGGDPARCCEDLAGMMRDEDPAMYSEEMELLVKKQRSGGAPIHREVADP